jgi:hypothetical protein
MKNKKRKNGHPQKNDHTRGLRGGHAALEGEEDQVGAAADAEFAEQVRDVKFYGALGNVEFAGDFFVGKILEERIENFLLAAAEIGDGIGFKAPALTGENGVNEARKDGARHPEAAIGDEGQRADELIAGFGIGEETLNAETEKLITVGVGVLFSDDDESSFGMAFEKIGQESASGGARGVTVDDVDLRGRRLEIAHVRREGGFELLDDDFELRSLRQNTFELAQHQRVRRQDTDRQFGRCTLGSH